MIEVNIKYLFNSKYDMIIYCRVHLYNSTILKIMMMKYNIKENLINKNLLFLKILKTELKENRYDNTNNKINLNKRVT